MEPVPERPEIYRVRGGAGDGGSFRDVLGTSITHNRKRAEVMQVLGRWYGNGDEGLIVSVYVPSEQRIFRHVHVVHRPGGEKRSKEQSMSDWISIEDGLPEKGAEVLVCSGDGVVRMAEYRGNDWWVTVPGGWNLYVVAWMPKPEPYAPIMRRKQVVPGVRG